MHVGSGGCPRAPSFLPWLCSCIFVGCGLGVSYELESGFVPLPRAVFRYC